MRQNPRTVHLRPTIYAPRTEIGRLKPDLPLYFLQRLFSPNLSFLFYSCHPIVAEFWVVFCSFVLCALFFQKIMYFTWFKIALDMTIKYFLNRISLLKDCCIPSPNSKKTSELTGGLWTERPLQWVMVRLYNLGFLLFRTTPKGMERQEFRTQWIQRLLLPIHNCPWACHPSTGTSLSPSSITISQAPTGCSAHQRRNELTLLSTITLQTAK